VAGCRGLEPLASGVTVSEITLGGGGQDSQAGGNTRSGSGEESSGSPGFAGILRPLGIPLVSAERGAGPGLERLLTVREVAAVLGVATSTVYQLCATGKLRHCRVPNAIRCASADVAKFVQERAAEEGDPPMRSNRR
jgi:excisionase family DNA binding protein